MELTTEVPQTGTRLRIDADRQFEQAQGDSVLRVQGEKDGTPVFDAAYVEVDERDGEAVAQILDWTLTPPPEVQDEIAQQVQATFQSKLSGRDANQIAHIATQATWQAMMQSLGLPSPDQIDKTQHPLAKLAERFRRAAAKRRSAYSGGSQSPTGQR